MVSLTAVKPAPIITLMEKAADIRAALATLNARLVRFDKLFMDNLEDGEDLCCELPHVQLNL